MDMTEEKKSVILQPVGNQHESKSGDQVNSLLKPEPGLIIWTWIVFGLLLLFFKKFGLKNVLSAMEEREKLIANAVIDAQKTKKALAEIEDTRKHILENTKKEAEEIIRRAREKADSNAKEIIKNAKEEGKKIVNEAVAQIEQEKKKSLQRLQEDIINMTLLAASGLAEKKITDEDSKKYIQEIIQHTMKR